MTLKDLLSDLVEHEEAMAGLYRALADAFPERAPALRTLADEEHRHAIMLRNARETVGKLGLVTAADLQASSARLTELWVRIGHLTKAAQRGAVTWPEALEELVLLEGSVGEIAIYTVISRNRKHPDFAFFARILDEEDGHERMLREWVDEAAE